MEKMQITREELAEVIENVMNTPSEGKEAFAELCTVATMTAVHLNDYLRFATQYPFTSKAVIAGLRVAAQPASAELEVGSFPASIFVSGT